VRQVRFLFAAIIVQLSGFTQEIALPPQPLARDWEYTGSEKKCLIRTLASPATFPGVCVTEDVYSATFSGSAVVALDAHGQIAWRKEFPDVDPDITFQDETSVIVRSSSGDLQSYNFRRLDSSGNLLWERTVPRVWGRAFFPDHSLLVSTPVHGELRVTKYDLDGNQVWTTQIPSGNGNASSLGSPLLLADGGYFLAGAKGSVTTNMPLITTSDAWIVRLDPRGTVVWDKTLTLGNASSGAGKAVPLPGGDFAVAADIGKYIPERGYVPEALLLRVTQGGDVVWTLPFTATGDEAIFQLTPMPDGGVLGSGELFSSTLYKNWLFRLTANGEFVWDASYRFASEADSAVAPNGDIFAFRRNSNPDPNFYHGSDPSISKFISERASFAADQPILRAPPAYVRYFPLDVYHLELWGEPGKPYSIQSSTDLRNWHSVGLRAPGIIALTAASAGSTFFRVAE
jgi:outer membrane protein assembly factor BamB